MSVITAKALNSTIGKDNFKAFDLLLSEHIDSLIDGINKKTDDDIAERKQLKKIVAVYSSETKFRYYYIGGEYGDEFYAQMPCDGSFYVNGGFNKKTIDVYINDYKQKSAVKSALVTFTKGQKIRIVVNNEYEQGSSSDPKSVFYIYAVAQ